MLSFVEIHLPDFRLFLHFIKLILNFNQFSTVLAAPTSPPPTLAELSVIMYHTTAVTRDVPVLFEFESAVKSKKEEKKINALRMSN